MKILLTANKTYRGILDTTWWYFYEPLLKLNHEVFFYDTVNGLDKNFETIVEQFKPELIFCIMTGDKNIAPFEPWEEIAKITKKGVIKTFNWFCDDTWRFNSFSSKVCHVFHVCSTPEPQFLEKFKNIGYDQIINANWHANSSYFKPKEFSKRNTQVGFIGFPNAQRKSFLDSKEIKIEFSSNLEQQEMFDKFCDTKIGLNLSFNVNDPLMGTQMKQRIFEITAGGSMLLTQAHQGIERFFEIDKEIVTFGSKRELIEKTNFLIKNPKILETIAFNGNRRFLNEHESSIRLQRVIEEIIKR